MSHASAPGDRRTWTVRDVLNWTRDFLAERGSESPRLDAEVLVAHAVAGDRIGLYTQHDRPLTEGERAQLRDLVRRRAGGEPVAYLTGEREFWSLPFRVDGRVLVPRPETEVLVEECLAPFRPTSEGEAPTEPTVVADVGTGSGAVAVVLARELPGAPIVHAIDSQEAALAVATDNVRRHGLQERVRLHLGRLLAPVRDAGPLDLVAANLPYVPTGALAGLPRSVRDFEPRTALDGGPDGLDLVRPCVAEAAALLRPGGWIVLELSDDAQIATVRREALASGRYDTAHVRADYTGRGRVLRLRRSVEPVRVLP